MFSMSYTFQCHGNVALSCFSDPTSYALLRFLICCICECYEHVVLSRVSDPTPSPFQLLPVLCGHCQAERLLAGSVQLPSGSGGQPALCASRPALGGCWPALSAFCPALCSCMLAGFVRLASCRLALAAGSAGSAQLLLSSRSVWPLVGSV